MKAAYEVLAVIVPIIFIVSAVVMVFASVPVEPNDPYDPVDPDPPVEPDPVIDLPYGITYDESTHTLSSESIVTWHVFDELHAYSENGKVYEGYESETDKIVLTPGKYAVTVGNETFEMTVLGKVSRSLEWDFIYNGESKHASVSYQIDIKEYLEINERSKKNNPIKGEHQFVDLPSLVTVNDTVRDIVSQLEERFVQIGGSTSDRHGYAEFLASMAQVAIEYPHYGNSYGDARIWGQDEYWQDTMETLYHLAGDCEDKSALACSLFIAAGYEAAMCGSQGHVMAGVALDDFKTRTNSELDAFGMHNWVCVADTAVLGGSDTIYYVVETIKEEQHYIGYLQPGQAKCIGTKTTNWGMAGFYPVHI